MGLYYNIVHENIAIQSLQNIVVLLYSKWKHCYDNIACSKYSYHNIAYSKKRSFKYRFILIKSFIKKIYFSS